MHFDPLSNCLFLCFKVRCLWSPCFGQWSTSFLRSFLWSFLFLSLPRIKQCLHPALNKNSTHHRDLFLHYSWAIGSFSILFLRASWGSALNCDLYLITPPPLKWLTEQKHPFEVCKHAERCNELGYKPLDDFLPSKTWLQISVCFWLERVCGHPLNKDFSQPVIGTFYHCHFQKMVGWVAFKFFFFMLKFKSFKCLLLS